MNVKRVKPTDDPPYFRYALIEGLAIEAPSGDLKNVIIEYIRLKKAVGSLPSKDFQAVMINDFRSPNTKVFEEVLDYEVAEVSL